MGARDGIPGKERPDQVPLMDRFLDFLKQGDSAAIPSLAVSRNDLAILNIERGTRLFPLPPGDASLGSSAESLAPLEPDRLNRVAAFWEGSARQRFESQAQATRRDIASIGEDLSKLTILLACVPPGGAAPKIRSKEIVVDSDPQSGPLTLYLKSRNRILGVMLGSLVAGDRLNDLRRDGRRDRWLSSKTSWANYSSRRRLLEPCRLQVVLTLDRARADIRIRKDWNPKTQPNGGLSCWTSLSVESGGVRTGKELLLEVDALLQSLSTLLQLKLVLASEDPEAFRNLIARTASGDPEIASMSEDVRTRLNSTPGYGAEELRVTDLKLAFTPADRPWQ